MSDYWPDIALIVTLILLNAFFAASEIAVISARDVRIRQLAEEGNRAAAVLQRLMGDPSRFLATIQVGITLAGFLASASAAVSLARPLAGWLETLGLGSGLAGTVAVGAVTLAIPTWPRALASWAPNPRPFR
ncbi:MAG: HlyC/CorC family transporter, partial [Bacillota bacterium]